ncbi:pilus assembly protein TadG-related protein [Nocardioides sp. C4-1]|uniref:pilus assembly protein TadG-related protein n=1 Tax=Nocardioides sp. C4-1 TaxID=3151851 RepID=UPI00326762E3
MNAIVRRLRERRRCGERGAISAFVVGITVTLLAVAGLVVDGGNALNARMQLADEVEQAARAGAQAIDQGALRNGGRVVINESQARARATSFLVQRGYTVTGFAIDGTSVTVSARDTVAAQLLTLVGVGDFTVNATATAEAQSQ